MDPSKYQSPIYTAWILGLVLLIDLKFVIYIFSTTICGIAKSCESRRNGCQGYIKRWNNCFGSGFVGKHNYKSCNRYAMLTLFWKRILPPNKHGKLYVLCDGWYRTSRTVLISPQTLQMRQCDKRLQMRQKAAQNAANGTKRCTKRCKCDIIRFVAFAAYFILWVAVHAIYAYIVKTYNNAIAPMTRTATHTF